MEYYKLLKIGDKDGDIYLEHYRFVNWPWSRYIVPFFRLLAYPFSLCVAVLFVIMVRDYLTNYWRRRRQD